MNSKCVLLFLAIGAVVVLARRHAAPVPVALPAKASTYTPANFSAVAELSPADNDAITEAAYHQAPTNFLPAFGSGYSDGGDTEVITLA